MLLFFEIKESEGFHVLFSVNNFRADEVNLFKFAGMFEVNLSTILEKFHPPTILPFKIIGVRGVKFREFLRKIWSEESPIYWPVLEPIPRAVRRQTLKN
jgi:hypothetical protein